MTEVIDKVLEGKTLEDLVAEEPQVESTPHVPTEAEVNAAIEVFKTGNFSWGEVAKASGLPRKCVQMCYKKYQARIAELTPVVEDNPV